MPSWFTDQISEINSDAKIYLRNVEYLPTVVIIFNLLIELHGSNRNRIRKNLIRLRIMFNFAI